MLTAEERTPHEPATPFPRLPDTLRSKYACDALALRPFGVSEHDLEISFAGGQPRPHLITEVLARCTVGARGEQLEPDFFWSLPVGKRIECLLTISETSGDRADIVIPVRCPGDACAQVAELELSLSEIVSLQNQTDDAERFAVRRGDRQLYVRRPTGSDQLAWLGARFEDEASAFAAMVRALVSVDEAGASAAVVGVEVDGGWIGAIEEALEEFDPLVNFSLSVRCPFCEAEHEHEVDLEELALRRLRQSQLRLLTSVHRLARYYHWSEREIFSVPHWRRAFYLALIDREEDR